MKVIWEIEDGYVGGSRPHEITIPDEEIDECESTEEIEELITDYVRDDFEQTVTFSWRIVKDGK